MKWTMNWKPASPVSNMSHSEAQNVVSVPQTSAPQEIVFSCNAGKKRKLSLSSSSDPCGSEGIPIRTFSGELCNLGKVHVAVQCPPMSVVKRTSSNLSKKELCILRLQIAMISDSDGDRPIHVAVAQENLKLVQKLCVLMLKASVSLDLINHLRQTPLHLAVMLGNADIVRLLLKFGSSVTLRDRNGNTALHLAVKSAADRDVLGLILSHPDAKDILDSLDHEGYSALHYAVLKSNKTAVWCLRKVGAQMNVIDGKSGRTPLTHAILNQNEEMVSRLLDCGACAEVADYSGRSAFELAQHASSKSVVRILENRLFSNASVEQPLPESSKTPKRILKRSKRNSKSKKNEDLRTI